MGPSPPGPNWALRRPEWDLQTAAAPPGWVSGGRQHLRGLPRHAGKALQWRPREAGSGSPCQSSVVGRDLGPAHRLLRQEGLFVPRYCR